LDLDPDPGLQAAPVAIVKARTAPAARARRLRVLVMDPEARRARFNGGPEPGNRWVNRVRHRRR
jgi:hypothetical protein